MLYAVRFVSAPAWVMIGFKRPKFENPEAKHVESVESIQLIFFFCLSQYRLCGGQITGLWFYFFMSLYVDSGLVFVYGVQFLTGFNEIYNNLPKNNNNKYYISYQKSQAFDP